MNEVIQSQISVEVVSDEIPRPPNKSTGVSLARVPLELLKKYSSPKPVRRPAPRPKGKTEEESTQP